MPGGEVTEAETPVLPAELDFEVPMLPENPEVVAMKESIHERIQAKMYHKIKEAEAMSEEQLEALLGWNEVPDLMMDTGGEEGITDAATKRKQE